MNERYIDVLIKTALLVMIEKYITNQPISVRLAEDIVNMRDPRAPIDDFGMMSELISIINRVAQGDDIMDVKVDDSKLIDAVGGKLKTVIASGRSTMVSVISDMLKNDSEAARGMLKHQIGSFVQAHNLRKVYNSFNSLFRSSSDDNIGRVLGEYIDRLKEFSIDVYDKDEALVDVVNFSDRISMLKAAEKATSLVTDTKVLRTGWGALNDMLHGGFRLGEFTNIAALSHNGKSLLMKSIFLQICRLNDSDKYKPLDMDVKDYKPLMVFISLEENVDNIIFFMYSYLKYTIDDVIISPKKGDNLIAEEMVDYITSVITDKTGFHIEILRYIPEKFDKEKLEGIMIDYGKQGYTVIGCILDYLGKMNLSKYRQEKTPMGVEIAENISGIRGFMSARDIMFLSALQLNSESLTVKRYADNVASFLEKVKDSSPYQGSKAVRNELDLELFGSISREREMNDNGEMDNVSYLYLARGKHRIGVPPKTELIMRLRFTNKQTPIQEDVDENGEKIEGRNISEFISAGQGLDQDGFI